MKAAQCEFPCSTGMVPLADAGAAVAATAADRVVIDSLPNQLEAAEHLQRAQQRPRRVALEAIGSMTSFVPAFVGMAGLATEPFLLYKMIGFDILHVRSSHSLLDCIRLLNLWWGQRQSGRRSQQYAPSCYLTHVFGSDCPSLRVLLCCALVACVTGDGLGCHPHDDAAAGARLFLYLQRR